MRKYGTSYGGYVLPSNLSLSRDAVIYSFGAGEDLSFDVEIAKTTGAKVHIFDFTPRAIIHYHLLQGVYSGKSTLVPSKRFGGGDPSYVARILGNKIKPSQLILHEYGLYTEDGEIDFYYPTNPEYVSLSADPNGKSEEVLTAPVKTLQTILTELNHTHIDILKLDIECVELEVLNQLLQSSVRPTYLAIDFDSARAGKEKEVKEMITKLMREGYKLLWMDNYDCSFSFST